MRLAVTPGTIRSSRTGKFTWAPPGLKLLRGIDTMRKLPSSSKRQIDAVRKQLPAADAIIADTIGKNARIHILAGSKIMAKFDVPLEELKGASVAPQEGAGAPSRASVINPLSPQMQRVNELLAQNRKLEGTRWRSGRKHLTQAEKDQQADVREELDKLVRMGFYDRDLANRNAQVHDKTLESMELRRALDGRKHYDKYEWEMIFRWRQQVVDASFAENVDQLEQIHEEQKPKPTAPKVIRIGDQFEIIDGTVEIANIRTNADGTKRAYDVRYPNGNTRVLSEENLLEEIQIAASSDRFHVDELVMTNFGPGRVVQAWKLPSGRWKYRVTLREGQSELLDYWEVWAAEEGELDSTFPKAPDSLEVPQDLVMIVPEGLVLQFNLLGGRVEQEKSARALDVAQAQDPKWAGALLPTIQQRDYNIKKFQDQQLKLLSRMNALAKIARGELAPRDFEPGPEYAKHIENISEWAQTEGNWLRALHALYQDFIPGEILDAKYRTARFLTSREQGKNWLGVADWDGTIGIHPDHREKLRSWNRSEEFEQKWVDPSAFRAFDTIFHEATHTATTEEVRRLQRLKYNEKEEAWIEEALTNLLGRIRAGQVLRSQGYEFKRSISWHDLPPEKKDEHNRLRSELDQATDELNSHVRDNEFPDQDERNRLADIRDQAYEALMEFNAREMQADWHEIDSFIGSGMSYEMETAWVRDNFFLPLVTVFENEDSKPVDRPVQVGDRVVVTDEEVFKYNGHLRGQVGRVVEIKPYDEFREVVVSVEESIESGKIPRDAEFSPGLTYYEAYESGLFDSHLDWRAFARAAGMEPPRVEQSHPIVAEFWEGNHKSKINFRTSHLKPLEGEEKEKEAYDRAAAILKQIHGEIPLAEERVMAMEFALRQAGHAGMSSHQIAYGLSAGGRKDFRKAQDRADDIKKIYDSFIGGSEMDQIEAGERDRDAEDGIEPELPDVPPVRVIKLKRGQDHDDRENVYDVFGDGVKMGEVYYVREDGVRRWYSHRLSDRPVKHKGRSEAKAYIEKQLREGTEEDREDPTEPAPPEPPAPVEPADAGELLEQFRDFSITRDEKDELTQYMGYDYVKLNEYLRGLDDPGADKGYREQSKRVLDGLIARGKAPRDMIVYRGASRKLGELEVGDELVDKAFLSTDANESGAMEFILPWKEGETELKTLIEIHVAEGTPGIYAPPLSDYAQKEEGEAEWLMGRNSRWRVIGKRTDQDGHGREYTRLIVSNVPREIGEGRASIAPEEPEEEGYQNPYFTPGTPEYEQRLRSERLEQIGYDPYRWSMSDGEDDSYYDSFYRGWVESLSEQERRALIGYRGSGAEYLNGYLRKFAGDPEFHELVKLDGEILEERRLALRKKVQEQDWKATSEQSRELDLLSEAIFHVKYGRADSVRFYTRELDSAIDKAPGLAHATRVYRGLDGSQLRDMEVGDEIVDLGFMSTTTDPEMAENFTQEHYQGQVVEILLPRGFKAAWTKPFLPEGLVEGQESFGDVTESESELVLPRGTRMVMVEHDRRQGPGTLVWHDITLMVVPQEEGRAAYAPTPEEHSEASREWFESITPEERNDVLAYASDSKALNGFLRDEEGPLPPEDYGAEIVEWQQTLDSALEKARSLGDAVVWRGAPNLPDLRDLEPGDEFVDYAYLSVSLDEQVARAFTGLQPFVFRDDSILEQYMEDWEEENPNPSDIHDIEEMFELYMPDVDPQEIPDDDDTFTEYLHEIQEKWDRMYQEEWDALKRHGVARDMSGYVGRPDNPVLFKIRTPDGFRMGPLDHVSGAMELMIPRGSTIRVTGTRDDGPVRIIEGDLIEPEGRASLAPDEEVLDFSTMDMGPEEMQEAIIEWAGERYGDYLDTLDSYEEGALESYKARGFEYMNPFMRHGMGSVNTDMDEFGDMDNDEIEALIESEVDLIEGVIDGAPPLEQPVVVYRGLGRNTIPDQLDEGFQWIDDAFVSTTLDWDKAWEFGTVAKITIPAGTKALFMETFNAPWGDFEGELLLQRGSHFRITGQAEGDVWEAELVPAPVRAARYEPPIDFDSKIGYGFQEAVDEWAQDQYGDWEESLSSEDLDTIEMYRGPWSMYAEINRYLRTGSVEVPEGDMGEEPDPEELQSIVDKLDEIIARTQKLREGVLVYRGVNDFESLFQLYGEEMRGAETGDIIQDDGFVSTTLKKDHALGFSWMSDSQTILKIEIPRGLKAAWLDAEKIRNRMKSDEFDQEWELVLPRGSSFEVVNDEYLYPETGRPMRQVTLRVLHTAKTSGRPSMAPKREEMTPEELEASLNWVAPPLPSGSRRGQGQDSGYSSDEAFKTNTDLGRFGEQVFEHLTGGERLVGDADRRGPFDVRVDGYLFEVKANSTEVIAYKTTPRMSEIQRKMDAARDAGLKPAIAMPIVDSKNGVTHVYWRPGLNGGRLSKSTGWRYLGSVDHEEAGLEPPAEPRASMAPDDREYTKITAEELEDTVADLMPIEPEELEALDDYLQQGFQELNSALREGDVWRIQKSVRERVEALDGLIARSSAPKDMVVWRGVRSKLFNELREGDEFVDDGFLSTSIDKSIASDFAETLVRIKVPKGHPGVYVDGVVADETGLKWGGEDEWLMARGLRWKIDRIDRAYDKGMPSYVELSAVSSQAQLRDEPPGGVDEELGKNLTRIGSAGGTTGATWYRDQNGDRWIVKPYKWDDQARPVTERLGADIFREAGFAAPEATITIIDGRHVFAAREVDAEHDPEGVLGGDYADLLNKGYVMDAWLANWDSIGVGDDPGNNVLIGPNDEIVRVDLGGIMSWRGLEGRKPFPPDRVEEIGSLVDRNELRNEAYGGGPSTGEIVRQVGELVDTFDDATIDRLVDRAGFEDQLEREEVRRTLKGRRDALAEEFLGRRPSIAPEEEVVDFGAMVDEDKLFDWLFENVNAEDLNEFEFGALQNYKSESRDVNIYLRDRERFIRESEYSAEGEVKTQIKRMDDAFAKYEPIKEPIVVYRGYGPRASNDLYDLGEGGEWTDDAFVSTSLERATARFFGSPIAITIPAGTKVIWLEAFDHLYPNQPASEYELLLPRGSKFQLTGTREDGTRTAELVPHQAVEPGVEGADAWVQSNGLNDWKNQLEFDEVGALQEYKGDEFRNVNDYLRDAFDKSKLSGEELARIEGIIDNIDSAIRSYDGLKEATIVYRGRNTDRGWEPGDTIVDDAFVSTSLDPLVAGGFALDYFPSGEKKGPLMRITLPKGTKGAWMELEPDSMLREELEFLLPRGAELQIKGFEWDYRYNRRIYDMEYVPPAEGRASVVPSEHQDVTPAAFDAAGVPILSDEERVAVVSYTRSSYQEINKTLRENGTMSDELWVDVARLDDAISRGEAPEDMNVYRGIEGEIAEGWEVGDEIEDLAFVSTTIDRDIARGFSSWGDEDVWSIKFEVRKGEKGLYVDRALEQVGKSGMGESEWLMPRGQRWMVTDIERRDRDRSVYWRAHNIITMSLVPEGRPSIAEYEPIDYDDMVTEFEDPGATTVEKETLEWYVGDAGFEWMNQFLREGYNENWRFNEVSPSEGSLRDSTAYLDNLIDKGEAPRDMVVYRGIDPMLAEELGVGAELSDAGFLSTSIDPDEARKFGHPDADGVRHLLELRVPKGSPGVYVDRVISPSWSMDEQEWLMPRDLGWTVDSIRTDEITVPSWDRGKKLKIYSMTQIPEGRPSEKPEYEWIPDVGWREVGVEEPPFVKPPTMSEYDGYPEQERALTEMLNLVFDDFPAKLQQEHLDALYLWRLRVGMEAIQSHLREGASDQVIIEIPRGRGVPKVIEDPMDAHADAMTVEEAVEFIDDAIARAPELEDDILLHRGVHSFVDLFRELRAGDSLIDDGYVATSTASSTASDYGAGPDGGALEITVPKGTKIAWLPGARVEQRDPWGGQNYEAVLPRGGEYRIDEIDLQDRLVKATFIPAPVRASIAPDELEVTGEEMERAYRDWRESLTPEEITGLDTYRGTGYRPMNEALRSDAIDGLTEWRRADVDALTQAIDRASTPKRIVVWRGWHGGEGERIKMTVTGSPFVKDPIGEGDIIEDLGFMSASVSREKAEHFAHTGTLLRIDIPEGSKAAYVSESGNKGEQELIVQRGARLMITGVRIERHEPGTELKSLRREYMIVDAELLPEEGRASIAPRPEIDADAAMPVIERELDGLREYVEDPADIDVYREVLVKHLNELFVPGAEKLRDRIKAVVPEIPVRITPNIHGDSIDSLSLGEWNPSYNVELGSGPDAPGFTVFTRDGEFEADDVLSVGDIDFFPPDQPELMDAYFKAVDAVRGVETDGWITLYRGMSPAEMRAWRDGAEIPVGKYFTTRATSQLASDFDGIFPELYEFRVKRSDVVETDRDTYQLIRPATWEDGDIASEHEPEGRPSLFMPDPQPSDDPLAALRGYQEMSEINGVLRELANDGEEPTGYWKESAEKLDAIFDAVEPTDSTKIVYRGMLLPDITIGDEFVDAGFSSTSKDRVVAWNFMGILGEGDDGEIMEEYGLQPALVRIRVPAGSHVIDMNELLGETDWSDDQEILLPRKSKFRMTDVDDKGVVWLTYLGPETGRATIAPDEEEQIWRIVPNAVERRTDALEHLSPGIQQVRGFRERGKKFWNGAPPEQVAAEQDYVYGYAEELDAIDELRDQGYTGAELDNWNAWERGTAHETAMKPSVAGYKLAEILAEAIRAHGPLPKTRVFRLMAHSDFGEVGDVWEDPGFMSTTLDIKQMNSVVDMLWTNRGVSLMVIDVPEGAEGAYLDVTDPTVIDAGFLITDEVLLQRGSKFRINSIDRGEEYVSVVHMEMLPREAKPETLTVDRVEQEFGFGDEALDALESNASSALRHRGTDDPDAIRDNQFLTRTDFRFLELQDRLAEGTIGKSTTLYRGMAGEYVGELYESQLNDVIVDFGFSSWSEDEGIASGYAFGWSNMSSVLVRMDVDPDTHGYFMDFGEGSEFVLDRTATMRVIGWSKRESDGLMVMDVELLNTRQTEPSGRPSIVPDPTEDLDGLDLPPPMTPEQRAEGSVMFSPRKYERVLESMGLERYDITNMDRDQTSREFLEERTPAWAWQDPEIGPELNDKFRRGADPDDLTYDPLKIHPGFGSYVAREALKTAGLDEQSFSDILARAEQEARQLDSPTTLFRGMVVRELPGEGDVIRDLGLTSLTSDSDTADAFALRVAPPGAQGGTGNPAMDEFLEYELREGLKGGNLEEGEIAVRWHIELPEGTRLWRGMNDLEEFVLLPGSEFEIVAVRRSEFTDEPTTYWPGYNDQPPFVDWIVEARIVPAGRPSIAPDVEPKSFDYDHFDSEEEQRDAMVKWAGDEYGDQGFDEYTEDVFKDYKYSGYREINGLLRQSSATNPNFTRTFVDMVEAMDRAFEETDGLIDPLMVYRGVGHRNFRKNLALGYQWQDQAYVSTTIDREVVEVGDFGETIAIHLPEGTQTIWMEDFHTIGNFATEWEVLLPRGGVYRVVGRRSDDVWIVEYTPPHLAESVGADRPRDVNTETAVGNANRELGNWMMTLLDLIDMDPDKDVSPFIVQQVLLQLAILMGVSEEVVRMLWEGKEDGDHSVKNFRRRLAEFVRLAMKHYGSERFGKWIHNLPTL